MASTLIRPARPEDRSQICEVEKKSTPGLIYLPEVFDMFVADAEGELSVAESDGQLVGCGKLTRLPDGSAWLETLRVIPERQGQGIGKLFYQRWLELARAKKITTLRMYTGVHNHASKGLAERFGFTVAGTYRGQKLAVQPGPLLPIGAGSPCEPVRDPALAAELLLAQGAAWGDFLVLNRTFYTLSPALAAWLAGQGMLYHNPASGSLAALGARFMPRQALHIGLLAGDLDAGLAFARQLAGQVRAASLSCMSPVSAEGFQDELSRRGFQFESADFLVMEARLGE